MEENYKMMKTTIDSQNSNNNNKISKQPFLNLKRNNNKTKQKEMNNS